MMLDDFLRDYSVSLVPPIMTENETYVIVEQTLVPNLMTLVYQHGVADINYAAVFDQTPYQKNAAEGPVLIQLTDKNNSFINLMTLFTKNPCGCFLQSSKPFNEVLTWARNALFVNTEKQQGLLRFYEPRMLLPLIGALSLDEQVKFTDIIDAIYWYHHNWLAYRNISERPIKDGQDFKLTLTAEQITEIQSIQEHYLEQLK